MPDDRLFHKRLGHSEKVNSLTDFEDLVWRQYILSADDFGVMRFSAVTLQAGSDRLAKKSAKAVMRALERVRDVGLVRTFEHQGRTYCFQVDWDDYQGVKYPRGTLNPKPPEEALSECTSDTKDLFDKHPGGWGRGGKDEDRSGKTAVKFPERSPSVSETSAKRFSEFESKPLAVSHKPLEKKADARLSHSGRRLRIPRWQHEALDSRLGSIGQTFDLLAWYERLERELEQTGEAFADPWKWLQARLQADANLPQTVQAQNSKTAGNKAALAQFLARGQG